MKKALFLLSFLLMSCSAGSSPIQALMDIGIPESGIDGIGEYKIGMDLASFIEAHPAPPQFSSSILLPFLQTKADVVEVVAKLEKYELNSYFTQKNFCPQAREFKVRDYQVAGLNLLDVRLLFYKDRLIEIETNDVDIRDAMVEKYGKGKVSSPDSSARCVSLISGFEFGREAGGSVNEWRNGDIFARSDLSSSIGDDCSKSVDYKFVISKRTEKAELATCNGLGFEKAKADYKSNNNLKDL